MPYMQRERLVVKTREIKRKKENRGEREWGSRGERRERECVCVRERAIDFCN